MKKTYLGDSVYAADDGFHIVLTTENGYGASNTICLDPSVIECLLGYIERARSLKITVERIKPAEEENVRDSAAN